VTAQVQGSAPAGASGMERGWPAHAAGLLIAAVYVAVLLATAKDIGFARDEGFYFTSAESYGRWFELLAKNPKQAIKKSSIDSHWQINSEHPALMKSLFAVSHIVFHKKLKVMRPSTAFRFPGMLMAGLLVYLVCVFGARTGGLKVGVIAALALALMPRFFYHAHLDCFDVPMATMWFAVAFAFWKSLNSFKWAIVTGLVWGLALETKLNAFFIPAVLLVFWVIVFARGFFVTGTSKTRPGAGLMGWPPIPFAFFAMVLIGPLVFLALWPYLWFDTIHRVGSYFGFHLHHPFYNIAYFNVTYFQPPFPVSYPFVMSLVTVPLTTSVLCVIGCFARLRLTAMRWLGRSWKLPAGVREKEDSQRGLTFFMMINMLVPMLIIALPSTPIFGGTKHWSPSWPFIALLAGFGFKAAVDGVARVADTLREGWRGRATEAALAAGMGILFMAAAGQQTEASHPFGLSHYTMPIGETPGSADAGMCRQFWGFTTGSALGWLNENVPPNGRVYFHDTAWDSYNMYHRDGTLRKDIQWSGGIEGADVSMVHWEQHMSGYEYAIWTWMGKATPDHVVTHQGVTILPLYLMPTNRLKAASPAAPGLSVKKKSFGPDLIAPAVAKSPSEEIQ
jgi:4-amino-4-deoxy-L-arabinose transferase-like glycosyltransferase